MVCHNDNFGHPSFLPLQLLALGYDALQQANPAWAACILDAQQLVTLLASPKRLWMASSKQVQQMKCSSSTCEKLTSGMCASGAQDCLSEIFLNVANFVIKL
jgi:hypothetical protein